MQQNSPTLIYDLNTTKGTVESYHKYKKNAQPFETVQFQDWKIAPSSRSLKKPPENCFEPPYEGLKLLDINFSPKNHFFLTMKIQHYCSFANCILERFSSTLLIDLRLNKEICTLVAIFQHSNTHSNHCLQSKSTHKMDSIQYI